MESFKGTGAECMVRFLAEGGKGTVIDATDGLVVMDAVGWADNRNQWWNVCWLGLPCTYSPPEPRYKDATPGEALDAWLSEKEVHVSAETLDEAIGDGEWRQVIPRVEQGTAAHMWNVRRKYRIRVD